MSERTYNRVANTLMLIGIASALLFDSGMIPQLVAGSIGIAAGVAAISMYFWNQSKAKEQASANVEQEAGQLIKAEGPGQIERMESAAPDFVVSAVDKYLVFQAKHRSSSQHLQSLLRTAALVDPKLIESYSRKIAARNFAAHYANSYARTLQWKMPKDGNLALMQPEVELSPNEVAECAVHIMRNLALTEDIEIWDYTLGPRGLRVSVRKTHVSNQPAQEMFDFSYISSPAF